MSETPSGEALRAWIAERGMSQAAFARKVRMNVGTLSHLLDGSRLPTTEQETAISEATEGAIGSWSRPRLQLVEGAAAPRELGTPEEEIRRALVSVTRAAEAPGVAAGHRAALETRRLHLIRELRRYTVASICEHPEFQGLMEDLVQAVVEVLGAVAPAGLEGRIADRLEELQARRVEGRAPGAA